MNIVVEAHRCSLLSGSASCLVSGEHIGTECVEASLFDGETDRIHEAQREPLVMDRGQRRGQDFLRLEEVVHVGTRVVRARVAFTALNERFEVAFEARIRDVEPAVGGVDRRITCHARRVHAVEGVCASRDASEKILGLGDTQQMAGAILAQLFAHPRDDRAEILLLERSADAEAVEALPVHLHVSHGAGCLAA